MSASIECNGRVVRWWGDAGEGGGGRVGGFWICCLGWMNYVVWGSCGFFFCFVWGATTATAASGGVLREKEQCDQLTRRRITHGLARPPAGRSRTAPPIGGKFHTTRRQAPIPSALGNPGRMRPNRGVHRHPDIELRAQLSTGGVAKFTLAGGG